MQDMDSYRRQLEQRRAVLEARLVGLRDNLRAPLEADFAEQASNLSDDEPMEKLEVAAQAALAEIEAALGRMAQGRYGLCTGCGEDIAPARLAALPEAALCMACASRA